MIGIHVTGILLMVRFVRMAFVKKRKMTTYNANILHSQTFCSFSLFQLRAVICVLIINIILNILGIFKICLGSAYLDTFLTAEQLNCQQCGLRDLTPIRYFETCLWILICQFIHVINWMQICEWKAMIYIIETQRDRGVGQITFDYHNENVEEIPKY
jgi:hypothetical protein